MGTCLQPRDEKTAAGLGNGTEPTACGKLRSRRAPRRGWGFFLTFACYGTRLHGSERERQGESHGCGRVRENGHPKHPEEIPHTEPRRPWSKPPSVADVLPKNADVEAYRKDAAARFSTRIEEEPWEEAPDQERVGESPRPATAWRIRR